MKFLISIFALALLLGFYGSAHAQTTKEPSELIKELLAAPAPPPRNAYTDLQAQRARKEDFFDKANVPPDDAPIEDLVHYWSVLVHRDRPVLSDTVRQRLLTAAADDLKTAHDLLRLLPGTDSYAQKIKQVFDNAEGNPELEVYRSGVKKWLLFNSKYFLDELLSLVNKVKDKNGYVENSEALEAIARVDWTTAEPVLETLLNTGQQRSATLALTLLYQHSVDKKDADTELKLRSRLQAIVADRSFPGRARNDAIVALSNSEWSGRDEWYLELLNDESLLNLHDGVFGMSPLTTLFNREPDKWIPVMTKLVAGKDRALQHAAASALVRHAISQPRRDAILPVLRWLTEPDWLSLGWERSSFVQMLAEIEVPESVPGLIWIVENDADERGWAARTLARYKDPRAIPALKKALAEVDEDDRELVLAGLLAAGGLTEAEQVKGLEAYATALVNNSVNAERDRDLDGPVPVPVSIGQYLANLTTPPDSLVRAVFARAASLRNRNLALSRSLLKIAHNWQGRQVNLDIVERIANNTAEADTIIVALKRRPALQESVRPELHSLLATAGVSKGIGAVLLDDNDIAGAILSSSDQLAEIGLLLAARLTQTSLSTGQVGPLLKSKNALLATAAERYLLAEDSKEAQTLLWQHHRNKAFITGWRENSERLSWESVKPIEKEEEKLRAELLKPDGPIEIYALLTSLADYRQVLRIYPDKAVYTFYEDSRYHERVVPQNDLSIFKEFIATNGLVDLGPQLGYCHHNCWVSQFLRLSKDASRRVFSFQGIEKMAPVYESFGRLGKGEGATTRYDLESTIKGLEVLYGAESMRVLDVWQRDNEIRVFVERPDTAEEKEARAKDYANEELRETRAEFYQREHARLQARLSWRILKDKDASAVTTVPDVYTTIDETRFPFDEHDTSAYLRDRHIQVLSPDSILIARPRGGLWKQTAGARPVRISGHEGAYAHPIVTPDRKWAVVAKADENWSGPNYLVILNLETDQESRVKLEPNEQLDPIAYLPLYEKILLRSAKDPPDMFSAKPPGPDVATYYLIDPKTGDIQPVAGEFGPLRQQGKRFLQTTNEPNQYWAALPDETKNQTVVGRYSLKDFSFKPILTVPQILFDSMSMWVDEKQGRLYFVYRGQLLRLPLSTAETKVTP